MSTPWLGPGQQGVTQGFGACELPGDCPHTGIDVSASSGTPIIDRIAGVVQDIVSGGGLGVHQAIDIGGGRQILLGHESAFAVPSGPVRPGEVIGYVGSTGFSTGPHLHFEEDVGGRPVDPSTALFSPQALGGPGPDLLNPIHLGQQLGSGQVSLPSPLGDVAGAVAGLPASIGHGLAGATAATAADVGIFLRNHVVELVVALVVALVLFG